MKNKKLYIIMGMISTFVLTACGKEANAPSMDRINAMFADNLAASIQTFTLDAQAGGEIIGEDGTKIIFCENAFLDSEGNEVVGEVQVELLEVLTYQDMVRLNKQTVATDGDVLKPLVSGGQLHLDANKDGQALKPKSNCVSIKVPTEELDPEMELFVSDAAIDESPIFQSTGVTVLGFPGFIPTDGPATDHPYYNIPLPDSFGWLNCDYIWNQENLTEISIDVPEGYNYENTMIWAVVPSMNSVISAHQYQEYFKLAGGQAPVGLEIILISLAEIENELQSATQTITVSEDMIIELNNYQTTTQEEFDQMINSL